MNSIVVLNEAEARRLVDEINESLGDIADKLFELYNMEGWKALGYDSWRACVTAEFNFSQSRAYQLLSAAKVKNNLLADGTKKQAQTAVKISTILEKPVVNKPATPSISKIVEKPTAVNIHESHLRIMAKVPPHRQQEVYQKALSIYGPKMTAAQLLKRVEVEIGKPQRDTTPSSQISSSPAATTPSPSKNLSPNTAVPAPAASLSSFSPAVCDTCRVSLVVVGTADDLAIECPKCGGSFCTNC